MPQSSPRPRQEEHYNTPELRDKIVFPFICLVIYRVGAHITVRRIDVVRDRFLRPIREGGLLGLLRLVRRRRDFAATVSAGIMPYILGQHLHEDRRV